MSSNGTARRHGNARCCAREVKSRSQIGRRQGRRRGRCLALCQGLRLGRRQGRAGAHETRTARQRGPSVPADGGAGRRGAGRVPDSLGLLKPQRRGEVSRNENPGAVRGRVQLAQHGTGRQAHWDVHRLRPQDDPPRPPEASGGAERVALWQGAVLDCEPSSRGPACDGRHLGSLDPGSLRAGRDQVREGRRRAHAAFGSSHLCLMAGPGRHSAQCDRHPLG